MANISEKAISILAGNLDLCLDYLITVEDGQKIKIFFLGEHKVITPEQQFHLFSLWYDIFLQKSSADK